MILVIFGTYLLFITGITALLKLLKKKKSFYYRSNHFTTVSGMLYRMKQNAAGLASICILFTCLLVTVSTTYALYSSMEDVIRTRFPRNILISATGANEAAKTAVREMVSEECEKNGLSPANILEDNHWSFTCFRQNSTFLLEEEEESSLQMAVLRCYLLEEFNRLAGAKEILGENEVLLYDPSGRFPEGNTLTIGERTYSLRKTEFDLSQAGDNVMITQVETYALIVPNEEIPRLFLGGSDDLTNYAPGFTYSFDVEGDRKEISKIGNALLQRISAGPLPGDSSYESLWIENAADSYEDFVSLYGGLFFLGIFLGLLFLLGTMMIIYYKQVSEGYEDARRFSIMQKVGMSRKEVKKSIHSQVLMVFFLPLLTAILHLGFAFPMLQKILWMMNLTNFWVIFGSAAGCVIIFSIIYAIIYGITARTYYKIVETAAD